MPLWNSKKNPTDPILALKQHTVESLKINHLCFWLIRFVSIVSEPNNISKDFNSSKIALWPSGPIHLLTHAVYKHFSSQYVVSAGATLFGRQGYLGHSGFLPCTAVVLSTALRPYIFHVISIKGTWYFLVTNRIVQHPNRGHIGKPSFLNDSHCLRPTKGRSWILTWALCKGHWYGTSIIFS